MPPIEPDEIELLIDRGFFKAKKKIDQEVTSLLLASQKKLVGWIESNAINLPKEVSLSPRKIAKGENYTDMPYWVSDFPAHMKGKDIWTFRTVVWWGHHISFSLMLSGKFKSALAFNAENLMVPGVYFTLAASPWKLEFTEDVQKECTELSVSEMDQHFHDHEFLKISLQEKLEKINKLEELTVLSFEKLIKGLGKLA